MFRRVTPEFWTAHEFNFISSTRISEFEIVKAFELEICYITYQLNFHSLLFCFCLSSLKIFSRMLNRMRNKIK